MSPIVSGVIVQQGDVFSRIASHWYTPVVPSNDAFLLTSGQGLNPMYRRQLRVLRQGSFEMTAGQAQLDLGIDMEVESPSSEVWIDLPGLAAISEPKGVVYTKSWVVDLILDLAGYRSSEDLAALYAVEPSAGDGAFFIPMIRRLLDSVEKNGRTLDEARSALHAYELDQESASRAIHLAVEELVSRGIDAKTAKKIAHGWVTVGDYLLESRTDRKADLVVGNPPYIRYDDLPEGAFDAYRRIYPTMVGRCDIYVGFIEAGVRQLVEGGALAFICADRWMRAAYGAELRRALSLLFSMEVVIEMHDAPAFENNVSAYPAVIVIRRATQGTVLVASANAQAEPMPESGNLADALVALAQGQVDEVPGFTATNVKKWFTGTGPWPSVEPHQLEVLRRLEEKFPPIEDAMTGTKIGIGVATGNDSVYVTTDPDVVESERLLPLAIASDTRTGTVIWSGHYLIDPWLQGARHVDLASYPRLGAYFEEHREELMQRNISKRSKDDWYRTIDRVNHDLTKRDKLYFPDMKLVSNPTLDRGETYPHHNLYYLVSDVWDLEVLGGLLLSRVAQLFIEAYCVKMRGGTLRFQAQYLRRIRVPEPTSMSDYIALELREAFRSRDAVRATNAAIEAYGIQDLAGAFSC
ncbi:MAG TPA: N-6 DNA methylase [Acidimicrobiales bacterium]|nr:N-6 DNA methylase [Acidimicrobiales bacterium]